MKCPNCGQELAENVRFCVNCGAKIEGAPQPKPAQQAQPVQQAQKPQPAPQQPSAQPQPAQRPAQRPQMPELTLNTGSAQAQAQPQQGSAAAGVGAAITAGVVGGAAAAQPQARPQPQPAQPPVQQPVQPQPQVQQYARPQAPQQGYGQAQVQSYQPQPVRQTADVPDERSKPYGTGGWMLCQFLEGLPLIGFICQLVWAFGSGNISRRNYARARLIWLLIGIAIVVVLSIVFGASFRGVAERIMNLLKEGYTPDQIMNAMFGGVG